MAAACLFKGPNARSATPPWPSTQTTPRRVKGRPASGAARAMGPAKWGQTLHSHDRLACASWRCAPTRAKKPASRERGRRPYLRREAPRFTRDAAEFESHAHWATKGSMMASHPKAKRAGAGGGLAQRASAAWGDGVRGAINWGKDARKIAIPKSRKSRRRRPLRTPCRAGSKKSPPDASKAAKGAFLLIFQTRRNSFDRRWRQRSSMRSHHYSDSAQRGLDPAPSKRELGPLRASRVGAPQGQAQPRRASPRRRGRIDWAKRASRVVMKKRHKTP